MDPNYPVMLMIHPLLFSLVLVLLSNQYQLLHNVTELVLQGQNDHLWQILSKFKN